MARARKKRAGSHETLRACNLSRPTSLFKLGLKISASEKGVGVGSCKVHCIHPTGIFVHVAQTSMLWSGCIITKSHRGAHLTEQGQTEPLGKKELLDCSWKFIAMCSVKAPNSDQMGYVCHYIGGSSLDLEFSRDLAILWPTPMAIYRPFSLTTVLTWECTQSYACSLTKWHPSFLWSVPT